MQEEEKKIKDELRIRPFPVLQELKFPRIEEKKPKECLEDIISSTGETLTEPRNNLDKATIDACKGAIEALKQHHCEDCISRQAVLDTIGNVPDYDDGMVWEALSHAQRDVALLPSVTPKVEWIPCNERLPKENEYIGNVCKYYLIQDEYGDMHVAHLSNVGWIPMNSLKAIGDEIIAWRELPERYKAESEG